MKAYITLLTLLNLLFLNLRAQQLFNPIGADTWGVAGSSVASQNVWSVLNNPAGFSALKKNQVGIYSTQQFQETKLSTASAVVVLPSKFITIGVGINYFGYSLFNQQKISASLSKQLFNQFSLGVTLSYFGTTITEQQHAGNILGEIGLLYKVNSKCHLGLFIFNPTQSKYSTQSIDKIPTYARIGVDYNVSEKVKLLGEVDQTLNQKLVLRGGIKYQIHEVLSLSIGAANNPAYLTFGTGIKLKQLKVDFAASFHQTLGFSPHVGLSFPVQK